MPLLINSKKFEISVRVLQGEGDGTLIYIDANDVLHVVPDGGDPRIDRAKLTAAVKQIEAGAIAFQAASQGVKAH
jgi:hypothetical protein